MVLRERSGAMAAMEEDAAEQGAFDLEVRGKRNGERPRGSGWLDLASALRSAARPWQGLTVSLLCCRCLVAFRRRTTCPASCCSSTAVHRVCVCHGPFHPRVCIIVLVQAYIGNYTGHAKLDRLLFIAERSQGRALELDALRMAHDELKKVRVCPGDAAAQPGQAPRPACVVRTLACSGCSKTAQQALTAYVRPAPLARAHQTPVAAAVLLCWPGRGRLRAPVLEPCYDKAVATVCLGRILLHGSTLTYARHAVKTSP